MRKIATIATAVALTMALAIPAMAGPPKGAGGAGMPAGIECQQNGIATLQALGQLAAVARTGVDTNVGSFSFSEVLALHRSNPELFAAGTPVRILRVGTLDIGGEGLEPTWCN